MVPFFLVSPPQTCLHISSPIWTRYYCTIIPVFFCPGNIWWVEKFFGLANYFIPDLKATDSPYRRVQLKYDGTPWRTEGWGGKWRGNWRMQWVAITLHTTSEHGVSSITTADAHTSAASSRLNWRIRRFKWTRSFRRKTKYDFCACAITFQTQPTIAFPWSSAGVKVWIFVHCLNGLVQFRRFVFSAPYLKSPAFERLPKTPYKFAHGAHYVKWNARELPYSDLRQ